MQHSPRWYITALATALLLQDPAAVFAQRASDEVERIDDAIVVLQELTAQPDDGIPQYLLQRAEAIVVIPEMIRGGLIVGAKHGEGIVSIRDEAREVWSPPAFISMTGGSVGWQIGAQSVDLVLLVMNRDGISRLLDNRFTIGGEVSVVAGPVGRTANAATDVALRSEILAYSRARGLFAGATLEGVALRSDDDANEAFYGRELRLREILLDGAPNSRPPIVLTRWFNTLRGVTSMTGGQRDVVSRADTGTRAPIESMRERGVDANRGAGLPPPTTFRGRVVRVEAIVADLDDYVGKEVMLNADVEDVYSRTVFAIDDDKLLSTGREVLVIAPSIRRPLTDDLDVTIVGEVMEFDRSDIEDRLRGYKMDLPDHLVDLFEDRPVILATSIRTTQGEELLGVVIRDDR